MNLTITKIQFMHGRCSDPDCPVCTHRYKEVPEWLEKRLTIVRVGFPRSPWWEVKESNGDCYRRLRGDLRRPGFYDLNPDVN